MTTVVDGLSPVLVGNVGAVVQAFLLLRASRLFRGQRVWRTTFLSVVGLLIAVAWVASLGASLANFAFTYGFYDKLGSFSYNTLAGTWLWCSAGTDLAITTCLILGMRRAILGFNENTDNAIRRMMRTSMLTASWTALFGVVGALLSVVFPPSSNTTLGDSLFSFEIPLSSLYALSLLTTLDSRKPIKRSAGVVVPR